MAYHAVPARAKTRELGAELKEILSRIPEGVGGESGFEGKDFL